LICVCEFAELAGPLTDGAPQFADLASELAGIGEASGACERLRDAGTTKILIAPNGPRCLVHDGIDQLAEMTDPEPADA
jgi:hypothetical protein